MAFRTGSYVHKLAERLNPTTEQSESWTYIFPGLKPDETVSLLKEFHQSSVSGVAGNWDPQNIDRLTVRTGNPQG